ncbi:hypothetical protein VSDG_03881 [Cytospora chrysosperma]|uniref:DUF726 domain-containing protein n=1 Tax=Cytospora chrysosperma TaxID=252740 RepID=A0A423W7C2_CYTCH|nr:hypothetical protein VSDG_03881 [Valsa sordida]
MAPSSSEPCQMVVVLNTARRKALYQLAGEITTYIRSQLTLQKEDDSHTGWGSYHSETAHSPAPEQGSPSASAKPAKADASVSQMHTPPSPELIALRKAALAHFDEWRKELLTKLKEILSVKDDNKILEARQERQKKIAQARVETPARGEDLIDFGDSEMAVDNSTPQDADKAVESLQSIYKPIPTRLTTLEVEDRREVLSAILILLLSTGHYSAYSRSFVTYLTSAFELPLSCLIEEEKEIAKTMIEASTEAEKAKKDGTMSADAEAQERKQQNQAGRFWKVGLASVAGAALIGVTGGLAAPVVAGAIGGLMGSVGLGGLASFLGVFWMNGALVGTLFGAFGAKMTGEMMDKYAREVKDFCFLPLKNEAGPGSWNEDKDIRRLRVTIGINGWLMSEDEVTKPWRVLGDETEAFALRYEMDILIQLGRALDNMVSSYAWGVLKLEILKRTVLATLWAALWPFQLLKLASGVDNPFNLAKNRSEKAGRILADALINKVQGERPVTLVGYSLGARVIYFCLKILAEREAFGLVDTVVFIGAPTPSNRNHWQMMRSVVAGKMFNVYSENDYILAFLYRTTSIQLGIAGLQAIEDIEGVENIDLSKEVMGHLRYPALIAQILTRCGFPNITGGEGPIVKEEDIQLEDTDRSKTGTLLELEDDPGPPVMPVAVKPLRKKTHREISFPTGIQKGEERPVVRKVHSVPVSAGPSTANNPEFDPGEPKSLLDSPPKSGVRSETSLSVSDLSPPPHSIGSVELPKETASNLCRESGHAKEYLDDDSDTEDDNYGGGIAMTDNDMVTYLEPLRLEDEEEK